MTDRKVEDESLMIDFLLGQMEPAQEKAFHQRIQQEPALQALRDNIANALGAVNLMPPVEPPADLVERTLARIRQDKQIKSLLARQESARRPAGPMFSMREVGAIAASILLMLAVFVPTVRQAHNIGEQKECAANLGDVGSAIGTYALDHDNKLPSVESPYDRWLTCDNRPFASNSSAMFQLVANKQYVSPTRMQCPAVGGGSFVVQAGMVNFPGDEFISYSYQHAIGRTLRQNDPTLAPAASQMVIMADKTPIFPDGKFHPERINDTAGDNHGKTGQNVLFMDYHVAWADNPNVGVGGDNIYQISGVTNYQGNEKPASATDTFLLPAYTRPCTIQP